VFFYDLTFATGHAQTKRPAERLFDNPLAIANLAGDREGDFRNLALFQARLSGDASPVGGRRTMIALTESRGEIFDAVKSRGECGVGYGQAGILQQQFCVFKTDRQQEPVWWLTGKRFEYAAEMEGAHAAMPGNLQQGDVVEEIFGDVGLGGFDGDEVIFLQPHIDAVVGCVVADALQRFFDHLQHEVVDLQFAPGLG
jgi:hypothetical protein